MWRQFVVDVAEKETYCSEECRLIHESAKARIEALEQAVSDHAQRFGTLQTPWWKRVLFWINGWPWHDLNAEGRSPWHSP
jgi:hypothetical protein